MSLQGEKFVDVEGLRTRYWEGGSGEVVVFIHGGNFGATTSADAIEDWGETLQDFSKWSRVLAIDKLGQGYTDNPKNDEDYTMDAVVQHVYKTLKTIGVDGAHLIGHSRGGYLACRLTVEHPELVQSCVIVSSNTCAPGTGTNEMVFTNNPEPALTREGQRWVLERYSYSADCVTEDWLDALTDIAQQQKYAETIDKMINEGLMWTRFLPGLQSDKEEMFRILGGRGIQRPVMLAWGNEDLTVSHTQTLELYKILAAKERRCRWQIFNQAGHFCFREQRKRFNEVVQSFIASA